MVLAHLPFPSICHGIEVFQFMFTDSSILELYILVCMKRLEIKEQNSYNFNSIMKGKPTLQSFSVIATLLSYQLIITCIDVLHGRVQKYP